jgi:hypothetical protein
MLPKIISAIYLTPYRTRFITGLALPVTQRHLFFHNILPPTIFFTLAQTYYKSTAHKISVKKKVYNINKT